MEMRNGDFEAVARAGEVISDKIEQELDWLIGLLEFVGFRNEVDNLKIAKERVHNTKISLGLCVRD